MATDRLTSTQPSQAGQRLSNHANHVLIIIIMRSGSERSERSHWYHCILCGLSIRMARPEASTPYGGCPAAVDIVNTPEKFMPKIKRSVHYLT